MQLSYFNEGRGGYILYKDAEGELRFSFEFGGGDCIVIIFVPKPEYWTKQTNRTPEERNTILTFVAEQSIKDQASGGRFVLSDNFIEIFSR